MKNTKNIVGIIVILVAVIIVVAIVFNGDKSAKINPPTTKTISHEMVPVSPCTDGKCA